MAKKKTPTTADLTRDLQRADREILKALSNRAKLATKVASSRVKDGGSAFDPTLETETIANFVAGNKGPLSEPCVRAIARELVTGSRDLARPLRVVYLGPQFSYSHLAAVERFGASVEMAGLATIPAVFEEINRNQADYGLVPIENSTDGRIVDTLGMFAKLPVKICGEVQLHIHHYLLGQCDHDQIREVRSKPQAISQCRDWLAKNLPAAKIVPTSSTTTAARLAAEHEGFAAIASRQAGVHYGLKTIAANVEDNPHNITRFAVIGSEAAKRSGRDKTALMLEISHEPGALAETMAIFKRQSLNLTWIESFPIHGSASEYMFFIEFEGHVSDEGVKKALNALKKKCLRLEVLGSYQKTKPIE